jgi:hypothetical protein
MRLILHHILFFRNNYQMIIAQGVPDHKPIELQYQELYTKPIPSFIQTNTIITSPVKQNAAHYEYET